MDDEALVLDVAAQIIENLGHEVVCSRNGDEALEKFRLAQSAGNPLDVVILDLTIKGGLGGEQAIGKLRELDPDIKAVVSSGYADTAVVAEYRKYGFSAFLNKPYGSEAMRKVLDLMLGHPKTEK